MPAAAQLQDSLYRASMERIEELRDQLEEAEVQLGRLRTEYRSEPERRGELAPAILDLESRLLALQGELTPLNDRIRAMELAWSMQQLTEVSVPEETPREELQPREEPTDHSTAPRLRNLVDNTSFREGLPVAEYEMLLAAQRDERTAADLVILFTENHARLSEMLGDYQSTTDQGVADSLYELMEPLQRENRLLDDSLSRIWNPLFDHKGYAYNLLLEQRGEEPLLEGQVALLATASAEADAEAGNYASDALTSYVIEKRALLESEITLADHFDLGLALDSLAGEQEYLQSLDYQLPRIDFARRYLLDYTPITFVDKSPYTPYNLPECKVHARGTIYRILLGSYKYRQQLNIFRGVDPLYVLSEGGRFHYYAGGFATLGEARQAVQKLRDKGFRQPIIMRWSDGRREEITDQGPATRYRVEIAGVESLSDAMRRAVQEFAPGKELARAGATFLVGPFDEEAQAVGLAQALRRANGSAEVRVAELGE